MVTEGNILMSHTQDTISTVGILDRIIDWAISYQCYVSEPSTVLFFLNLKVLVPHQCWGGDKWWTSFLYTQYATSHQREPNWLVDTHVMIHVQDASTLTGNQSPITCSLKNGPLGRELWFFYSRSVPSLATPFSRVIIYIAQRQTKLGLSWCHGANWFFDNVGQLSCLQPGWYVPDKQDEFACSQLLV